MPDAERALPGGSSRGTPSMPKCWAYLQPHSTAGDLGPYRCSGPLHRGYRDRAQEHSFPARWGPGAQVTTRPADASTALVRLAGPGRGGGGRPTGGEGPGPLTTCWLSRHPHSRESGTPGGPAGSGSRPPAERPLNIQDTRTVVPPSWLPRSTFRGRAITGDGKEGGTQRRAPATDGLPWKVQDEGPSGPWQGARCRGRRRP